MTAPMPYNFPMEQHDSHYKSLFSHKEMVRDLLQGFVEGDWLKNADFDSLEQVNSDFVSERIPPVQRHEDMIWRLRVGDNWIYLYLLLEFQSSSDRWMALRMLSYTALLWERLVKQGELAPRQMLPPVLPIVLYNGEKPWRATSSLDNLCYPAPRELQAFQPRMRYLLLDERSLLDKAQGMHNLAAAVFQLEFSATPADMRRVLQELATWVEVSAPSSLQRSLYRFAVKWLRKHSPDSYPAEMDSLEGNMTMLAQRVEQWEKDIHQEGRQEGREIGRADALLLLLENRFGSVSEDHQTLIAQADAEQLNAWLIKTLSALTVDEVFGGH